ncbi:uncharacterized protein ARMOST_16801 [Armillaria ostoyae]|uniref:Uncharacterized protein n=1 Tax=Armillaria ostoyae TaxID=47428 RepID=A0A284RXA7_ARMOS|nr:uncharacterized protein ARMOST_16801 [Armillaria ostoyae]
MIATQAQVASVNSKSPSGVREVSCNSRLKPHDTENLSIEPEIGQAIDACWRSRSSRKGDSNLTRSCSPTTISISAICPDNNSTFPTSVWLLRV